MALRNLLFPSRSLLLQQSSALFLRPLTTTPSALSAKTNRQKIPESVLNNLSEVVEDKFKLKSYKGSKANRHWLYKWKGFRRMKMVKVQLPKFQEMEEAKNLSPEEMRAKMKERGIAPGRPWMERPIEVSSTQDVFEPYVPPEGDGKASLISTERAKQSTELVSKKGKSYLAFRKIRTFEEDFTHQEFLTQAEKIYLDVFKAIMAKDRHWIRTLVTEKAYPEATNNMNGKTVHWKFLESIEPPRIVHARCTDVVSKENVFAQITCRFFTKQILAVYDRFGRLAHGSEVIAKDVLEYVVFEKHLANEYGIWRVHAKIIPPWLNKQADSARTYVVSRPEEEKTASIVSVDRKEGRILLKLN